jgi:hypothetical protein
MENSAQAKRVPVSQVAETLEKTIVGLDQARAADLGEMSEVRAAKFTVLARDRVRLAAKLGPTHPRVLALDGSLALHAQTVSGFASEIAISTVPQPRVDQSSWALHGIVLDASRKPIQGVTVALYQKDTWAQNLGFACTDANGYFVLMVQDALKIDHGPFSIDILRNQKVIFIAPDPGTIQPGHVEFREIVIDATANTCAPPEGNQPAPPPAPTPSVSTKRAVSTKPAEAKASKKTGGSPTK